jgi:F-type H+-transporting ATPase subunit a
MQNVNLTRRKAASLLAVLFFVFAACFGTAARAQDHAAPVAPAHNAAAELDHGTAPDAENEQHAAEAHGEEHETPNAFTPHAGTWINPIARGIFGLPTPKAVREDHSEYKPGEKREAEVHFTNVKYDYLVISFILMALLAIAGVAAAKKATVRPEGKPNSLSHGFEAAADGFHNYLVGVMGEDLARKYAPLIASFFFTILLFNWTGLIPGLMSPTANPNVPFALAIVSFFMVHVIAIRETGFKAWFLHLVGEPRWMAPLMFPLHVVGELVKPVSLALRLLGNVFGEEVVVAKLIGLAILAGAALGLPTFLPFQLPIMLLGVFFGFLQALVFSTLLAIYIAILGTHHDDHDAHNAHGHVEHIHTEGHHEYVAHGNQLTIG